MKSGESRYCANCPNFRGGWFRRMMAMTDIIDSNKTCDGPLDRKFAGGVVVNLAGFRKSQIVHTLEQQCSIEYPTDLVRLERDFELASDDLWSGAADEGVQYFSYPGGATFNIESRINAEGKVE